MSRSELVVYIRALLQDSAKTNALLQGEELTDDVIDSCIQLALADFNVTPPTFTQYTVETFPAYSILIHGAIVECLTMAGILASRNRLNYNAGGVQVDVNTKAADYMSWISMLMQRYQDMKIKYKKSASMASGYGYVASDYSIAGLHGIAGALSGRQLDDLNY